MSEYDIYNYLLRHVHGTIGAFQISLPYFSVFVAAELLWPGQRINWRVSAFNWAYAPIFLTVSSILLSGLWSMIPLPWLEGLLHMSRLDRVQQVAVFALYLLMFDFCYYWLHRAQHKWHWLWRYHATHHSDPNVSAITTCRHHWLEDTFRFVPILLPLSIVFGSLSSLPLWALVIPGLYGIFIHWNCPFRMHLIQRLIVTPWFHRIHHSTDPVHRDKNFAVFFPFWDILFRTASFPTASMYPMTGINTDLKVNSWRRFLPWPQQ